MTSLSRTMVAALATAGFQRRVRDEFFRLASASMEHVLMFYRARDRSVQVSAAVRQLEVEQSIGPIYRLIGLRDWASGLAARGQGYTAGLELGNVDAGALVWDTPIFWFDGAAMSVADAAHQMNRIQSLSDIHALYASSLPQRQSWVARTELSWLRYLIIVELLRQRSAYMVTSSEMTAIRSGLSHSDMFSRVSFDEIQRAVAVVAASHH